MSSTLCPAGEQTNWWWPPPTLGPLKPAQDNVWLQTHSYSHSSRKYKTLYMFVPVGYFFNLVQDYTIVWCINAVYWHVCLVDLPILYFVHIILALLNLFSVQLCTIITRTQLRMARTGDTCMTSLTATMCPLAPHSCRIRPHVHLTVHAHMCKWVPCTCTCTYIPGKWHAWWCPAKHMQQTSPCTPTI